MEHWKLIVERKDGNKKLPDGIFIIPVNKLEKEFADFLLQCDGKSWNNDVAKYKEEPCEVTTNQGLRVTYRWARTAQMSLKLVPYMVEGELPDTHIDKTLTFTY